MACRTCDFTPKKEEAVSKKKQNIFERISSDLEDDLIFVKTVSNKKGDSPALGYHDCLGPGPGPYITKKLHVENSGPGPGTDPGPAGAARPGPVIKNSQIFLRKTGFSNYQLLTLIF